MGDDAGAATARELTVCATCGCPIQLGQLYVCIGQDVYEHRFPEGCFQALKAERDRLREALEACDRIAKNMIAQGHVSNWPDITAETFAALNPEEYARLNAAAEAALLARHHCDGAEVPK